MIPRSGTNSLNPQPEKRITKVLYAIDTWYSYMLCLSISLFLLFGRLILDAYGFFFDSPYFFSLFVFRSSSTSRNWNSWVITLCNCALYTACSKMYFSFCFVKLNPSSSPSNRFKVQMHHANAIFNYICSGCSRDIGIQSAKWNDGEWGKTEVQTNKYHKLDCTTHSTETDMILLRFFSSFAVFILYF